MQRFRGLIPDFSPAFALAALGLFLTFGMAAALSRPAERRPLRVVDLGSPELTLPLKDAAGTVRLGGDGLIPVEVRAKLNAQITEDALAYFRVTSTRVTPSANLKRAAHERVWSEDYLHHAFPMKRGVPVDRTFGEKVLMPSGTYYILIELCSTAPATDVTTGEPVSGQVLVGDGFYVTVP